LDPVVQMEINAGKPEYNPSRSQLILQNEFNPEAELNFTPYQQAHIGVTKHSATLAASNPLMHKA